MKQIPALGAALCAAAFFAPVTPLAAADLIVGNLSGGVTTNFTSGTNSYDNTYVGYSVASSLNTLNVLNSGTLLTSSDYVYVGFQGSSNSLVISNGGTVANRSGYISSSAGSSNNSVLVTGSNSLWTNTTELAVGLFGSGNSLVISNGGTVAVGSDLFISTQAGSANNSVSISSGSLTVSNGKINIGRKGLGTLNVAGGTVTVKQLLATNGANSVINFNGGTIISEGTTVNNGSDFKIGDTGSGATFIANGGTHNFATNIIIGFSGSSNSLVISNGATVANTVGYIGFTNTSSSNSVLVTDGGTWTNSAELHIGYRGSSNSLVISNGSTVASLSGRIGHNAISSNNSVLVTGSKSLWTNSGFGNFSVGFEGSGNSLIISDGATVANTSSSIGNGSSSSNNSVLVTGTRSRWTNSATLYVGNGSSSSSNSLVISDGATVANGTGYIGNGSSSSNNSVLVTGTGSTWTNSATLYLGNGSRSSSNSLVISDGGKVAVVSNSSIGFGSSASNNSVLVTGTNSLWTNSAELHVGYRGSSNSLVISNGGTVAVASNSYIGFTNTPSNNSALVTGTSSLWTSSGDLYVGYYGGSGNSLVISNGGTVAVGTNLVISALAGASNNSVSISGGNLTVSNGQIDIGRAGSGTLNVTGGMVTVRELLATNGANSMINFNGGTIISEGTTVSNGSIFKIGDTGSGATFIANGGTHSFASMIVGKEGSSNRLIISNGGRVTNGTGLTGEDASSSDNSVLVTGTNSLWTNSGSLYVGFFGAGNSLVISNGGTVANTFGEIGAQSSSNSVLVTGTNSFWVNSNSLSVGSVGSSNSLVITNGGTVANKDGYIGTYTSTSTNNSVLVAGLGSLWTNNGALYVGYSGSGNSLVISNWGTVANSNGAIGFLNTSSNNSVLVTGAGSVWTNSGDLYVGYSGTSHRMVIADGGKVYNVNGYDDGASPLDSSNSVLVTDAGSAWVNSGNLTFGLAGHDNSLVISNGGLVTVGINAYAGDQATASNNSVFVTGTNAAGAASALSVVGSLYVGNEGSGNSLVISNGGRVASQALFLGGFFGGTAPSTNNSMLVTGEGSAWNGSSVAIGASGSGNSLVISDGGKVVAGNRGYIGTGTNSTNNSVLVTGAKSLWTTVFELGFFSSGNRMVISNGGTVAAGDSLFFSSNNSVLVTGTNSLWTNSSSLYVGFSGSSNSVVISDGSSVVNSNGYIGDSETSSNNSVLVTDDGSVWTNSGDLYVGNEGSGNSLVISNGGMVANSRGYIGYAAASSNNSVLVTGAGSLWTNSNDLVVGNSGGNGNSLTIADGGAVAALRIVIAQNAGSSGTLNIGRFGTNDTAGTIIAPTIAFGNDAGVLNFNQSDATTITSVISGAGALNQLGAGTTTLSGANSYSGTTLITNGTLQTANATALGTSTVQLDAGSLAPVGTLNIQSLVWNGGTIASTLGTTTSFVGVATNFTLGAGGGTFAFTNDGGFVANTNYAILGWTNWGSITASSFSGSAILGLNPIFTIDGTNLLVTFGGATNGPILQNSAFVYTPLDADFLVSNNVTTGKTNEDNTVAALTFQGASTLTVYNTLNVTNGNFTVSNGLAKVTNGTLATPGDFNKLGAGTLALFGAAQIGSSAVIDAGALLVEGNVNAADVLYVGQTNGNIAMVISNGGTVANNSSGIIGGLSSSSNNSVLVTGTNSLWTNSGGLVVGNSGSGNSLVISDGGKVTVAVKSHIGLASNSSNNNVLVTGSNSLWTNSGNLRIGRQGSGNSLVISNAGAVAVVVNSYIGAFSESSNNSVLVTGSGSLWTNSGDLYVGYEGSSNSLVISDGGSVVNSNGYIGSSETSSNNSVLVTDDSSVWTNSGSLYVGNRGSGNLLVISNGGTVANGYGYIGDFAASSNNSVLVTGSNSLWTNSLNLFVGASGSSNSLLISNGGRVEVQNDGYIGLDSSNNSLLVTGPGSTWTNTGQLFVGVNGSSNTLVISNGGMVGNNNGRIAANATSSNNSVLVTGSNSTWINSNYLRVGESGSGNSLVISSGGKVASGDGYIGLYTSSSNNSVLVTGSGSLWTNSNDLLVGAEGRGNSLVISNGGTVANIYGYVGVDTNSSNNSVLVTGSNSLWTNSGDLSVGGSGSGNSLVISNAGMVANSSANIGFDTVSSNNSVLVTGSNSLWTNSSNLSVGYYGNSNSLVISNGGMVASSVGYIGVATSSSNNSVLVTEVGSLWTNSSDFYAGIEGSANSLVISKGGRLEVAGNTFIGYGSTSSNNSFLVTGAGSLWTNSNDLIVGYEGGGSLTVADGGTVAASNLVIAASNGSSGTLNIGRFGTNDTAGTIIAPTIAFGSGTGAINFNQANDTTITAAISGPGTINQLGAGTTTLSGANTYGGTTIISSGALQVGDGGNSGSLGSSAVVNNASLIFNRAGSLAVEGAISGSGSIRHIGPGTTTLSGANTYTGPTLISNGTLQTANASALGTSAVQVNAGSLAPVGTLNIQSLIWNGGTIASALGTTTSFVGIATNFTLGTNGGNFAFTGDSGFAANTAYSILGWTNMGSFALTNFSGNALLGLTPIFTINGTNLLVNFEGSSSGSIIQNGGPTYTPTYADFFVSNNVTTMNTNQNNIVNSLIFAPNSSLQVYNQLQVTSGNFTVNSGSATVQGGQLFVPGDFTKLGDGLLNLLGKVLVNGRATVSAGGLLINGEFTTDGLTVLRNALLGGAGTIFGNVFNYGTVSPGNSPGTLNIVGNYTQGSTGNLAMEIAGPNNFDRLVVSGTSSLAGTLTVTTVNGGTLSFGDKYQFLSAGGGISGEFDTIAMPSGLRGRFLTDSSNTQGTLLVAPLSYTQVAVTPNQRRVAKALDAFIPAKSGDRETVSIALDELTAEQYPSAFEAIMPSLYASLPTMAFNVANALNTSMFQRMWMQRISGRAISISGIDPAPLRDGKQFVSKGTVDEVPVEEAEDDHWGVFVDGNGVFANANSGGLLQDYKSQSGGVTAGASYKWCDSLATGVYAGYQGLQAQYDGGSRVTDNAVRFGGFGAFGLGGFYANGLVGGAYHTYDMDRSIEFGTIDRTARGDTGAGELDVALSTGYDIKAGNFTFGPVTSLQYTYLNVQGFNETGADSLNLDVQGYNSSSLLYSLGAQAAYRWQVTKQFAVTPMISASWQHEFLQNAYTINSSFNTGGGSSPFGFQTTQPQQDYFYAGAGVGLNFGDTWEASFFWNAAAANDDQTSQNIYFSIGAKF